MIQVEVLDETFGVSRMTLRGQWEKWREDVTAGTVLPV